jgi:hypothetical protein
MTGEGAQAAGVSRYEDTALIALMREKYQVPPDPTVLAFIQRFREIHGPDLKAVVLYGSRLWEATRSSNSILDFFLFAGDYRSFYRRRRDAWLNRVLAPNTYRLVVGSEQCKYNVVSLTDLERATSAETDDLFHAGRFSKRVGIAWADSEASREEILRLCLAAMKTVVPLAISRLGSELTFDELLFGVLAISYAAELRVEAESKVAKLLHAEEAFYRTVYGELLAREEGRGLVCREEARGVWIQDAATLDTRRRRTDELLQRSRLRMYARWPKYMATLDGWLEMLLDKIERTKGIRLELSPLQRKYPYLFGWGHFFRMMRKGMVK